MIKTELKSSFTDNLIEAGCDEAGRGCLAGPVVAAAVILPKNFKNDLLDDSKKLSEKIRFQLREVIKNEAISWSVTFIDNFEIDKINILNASILAMQKSVNKLNIKPQLLLIDGNRFKKYQDIPHKTIIKGDGIYYSIAAASVLAKTFRDDFMDEVHNQFPQYNWLNNKGYPTKEHREAILKYGICKLHRKTFCANFSQYRFDNFS